MVGREPRPVAGVLAIETWEGGRVASEGKRWGGASAGKSHSRWWLRDLVACGEAAHRESRVGKERAEE